MSRQIHVYYTKEDGKILGYSAKIDQNFDLNESILVPLDEMRKFYDGTDSINFYEILNSKLQKKDEYVYDESYVNEEFFKIGYQKDADFRVVCFKDCIVIFPCDIDQEAIEFRMKLEATSVLFYFTKKDDPSILLQEVAFDESRTSMTIVLDEKDFSVFALNPDFTYSLEFVND